MLDDKLHADLQRTIERLREMSEDGYAPPVNEYDQTAVSLGLHRMSWFVVRGLGYKAICEMAGLQNRPSGPPKGFKPAPNGVPVRVETEVRQMITRRQQWQQALAEFPLQAIPTRTEEYLCTVGETVYRVTRQYASLR